MRWYLKLTLAAGLLAGCAPPDPFALKTLPKGAQVDVRALLAEHPKEKICVDYRAASNSCGSFIYASLKGDEVVAREVGALLLADGTGTQNIEVVTRSTVQDGRACARASDISVTGLDEMSEFVQGSTREMIAQFGGQICASYYRAGEGYVVSTTGANGQPVPPGDIRIRFGPENATLRAE